jgi:hypothetical protein
MLGQAGLLPNPVSPWQAVQFLARALPAAGSPTRALGGAPRQLRLAY